MLSRNMSKYSLFSISFCLFISFGPLAAPFYFPISFFRLFFQTLFSLSLLFFYFPFCLFLFLSLSNSLYISSISLFFYFSLYRLCFSIRAGKKMVLPFCIDSLSTDRMSLRSIPTCKSFTMGPSEIVSAVTRWTAATADRNAQNRFGKTCYRNRHTLSK